MIRAARGIALVALVLLAMPAIARAPETSLHPLVRGYSETEPGPTRLRPRARPAGVTPKASDPAPAAPDPARMRPRLRPASDQMTLAAARPVDAMAFFPDTSPRPWARPDSIAEKAFFKRRKKRKGSVCGDIEIQGKKVGDVPGKIRGCGVQDAVSITSVSGVMLSRPATMNCETAQALNAWVSKGLKPTFRRRGPVVEMRVAAHYACRTRNNQPGGRISEHGKGKAIDISAFTMKDGEVITVKEGWVRGSTRRLLQKVHKAACGPFGTVLGPDSDRYHRDHFHFDTASYRSGPFCR